MTRTKTFAFLPVWAILLAALLMLFALRTQIAQTLPFTSNGHHISAPQLGPAPMNAPVVGNQPANAQGSSTVITKTGTTSPNQPAQQATQQPSSSNQAAANPANNPCARAGNPAPMCPVRAP
ncbi:MAG TPA: hypothetical protein VMP38_03200 [Candidatus Acidoferrum sp.]|nr:hypothetical protein [Candidatus Acidoferrum sp.]